MSVSSHPSSLREAFACALLGFRDGLSPRLLLFSLGLWAGAVFVWTLALLVAGAKIKAAAAFIAAWSLLGLFILFPTWLPATAQAKLTGVPLADGAHALLGPVFATATWIVLVLLVFVAVIATARIALEVWLMPVIRRVVEKHYPPFPLHPTSSLLSPVVNVAKTSFTAVALGVPFLLVPVLNVVLLFVLFGYLNVRTLVNESLDGLAPRDEQRAIIRAARFRMVLLGCIFAGAQLIPFVSLFSPCWIGAGTCHLCVRQLLRNRSLPT